MGVRACEGDTAAVCCVEVRISFWYKDGVAGTAAGRFLGVFGGIVQFRIRFRLGGQVEATLVSQVSPDGVGDVMVQELPPLHHHDGGVVRQDVGRRVDGGAHTPWAGQWRVATGDGGPARGVAAFRVGRWQEALEGRVGPAPVAVLEVVAAAVK